MSENELPVEARIAEDIRKKAYLICPDLAAQEARTKFPDTDLLCRKLAVALRKVDCLYLCMEFEDGTKWKTGIKPLGDDLPASAYQDWHNLTHWAYLLKAAINTIIMREADKEVLHEAERVAKLEEHDPHAALPPNATQPWIQGNTGPWPQNQGARTDGTDDCVPSRGRLCHADGTPLDEAEAKMRSDTIWFLDHKAELEGAIGDLTERLWKLEERNVKPFDPDILHCSVTLKGENATAFSNMFEHLCGRLFQLERWAKSAGATSK